MIEVKTEFMNELSIDEKITHILFFAAKIGIHIVGLKLSEQDFEALEKSMGYRFNPEKYLGPSGYCYLERE